MPHKLSSSHEGIGVSVLLRNWTLPSNESGPFATAASDQLKYLLFTAPRTLEGAISHRTNQTQLWADFIYMAPPFIAYYGALQCGPGGDSLMWMAYEQVKLHREELFDKKVGLWRHTALGNGTDHKHWATGNAWAAAGALRVLATIQRSHASKSIRSHQKDLMKWVGEILDGVWKFQVGVCLFHFAIMFRSFRCSSLPFQNSDATLQHKNGTLLNYIDDSDSFADSSSTALLAATTFRFASIAKNDTHIPAAIRALRLVRESVDRHGWLHNTVNPLKISTPNRPGHHSPEGQSFVLLLEAAVSEWASSHKNYSSPRHEDNLNSSRKKNSSHGKHPAHGKHPSHKKR